MSSSQEVSAEQIRWFRLQRSGLVEPFDSSNEAARDLMGIQAQILPAAGVSLWNRCADIHTYEQFLDLLFTRRSLVKLWGQRGTLHLYPSDDWPLVYSGFTDRPSWWERKTIKDGGDVEEFRATVQALARLLRDKQILTRSDLRASSLPLNDLLLSSWGGIFHELVRKGHACHGPAQGNEGSVVCRHAWLPELEWSPVPAQEAHILWTLRYIRAYGPARLTDIAYWRGARLAEVKSWLKTLAADLTTVTSEDETLWLYRDDLDTLCQPPPPRRDWPLLMLYRFDPLLLAHKDKSWLLDPEYKPHVWRPAGHIEGTVLSHGRIVGTWRYKRQGTSLEVTAHPFTTFPKATQEFLAQRAEQLAEFFGARLTNFLVSG